MLETIRERMRKASLAPEAEVLDRLVMLADLRPAARADISKSAEELVEAVRQSSDPGLMETLLAEYGLSTREGVALMCLAEALLRVPDAETIDALIEDKIAPSDWGSHLGHSSSSLVNASTWALLITGKVLHDDREEGIAGALRGAIRRLGEPVIRKAVGQAMRELGGQFVLGRTIEEAMKRAADLEKRGYTHSYDMLGEAARTEADAKRYHLAYSRSITALEPACIHKEIPDNPGISVKLSALHPRYEFAKRETMLPELVARARSLALLAQSAGIGLNIDAEEADRLDLSLDVIEAIVADPSLRHWRGLGVVVQAFGRRAVDVIEWLHALAEKHDRRIMIRLVKGAYWDTEIKRGQVLGLESYPVFTRKPWSDISYIACARLLLSRTDRIYPQFATHNAHSIAAVLHLSNMLGIGHDRFEFQRLHGMGETLHETVRKRERTRCRIYAPVGAHHDLLAYLVRRLLENGANSSFVNQIVNESIPPARIAADPFAMLERHAGSIPNTLIRTPPMLYGKARRNAMGFDLADPVTIDTLDRTRAPFARGHQWHCGPLIADDAVEGADRHDIVNPADPADVVGSVADAVPSDIERALAAATTARKSWADRTTGERAALLRRTADLYEEHAPELFAIAAREAGKTLLDAVGEIREAVDFLRYYANEAETAEPGPPRGVFVCISPWNFPLAIFTGQIAAALVTGNTVLAKPAEQTPLMAARAVSLMHEAGIPRDVLQLLPGDGARVGARLTADPRVDGICFTGSTDTARLIHRSMAENAPPGAPLIAETGGLNAMIVDSTALPEQAVRDIIASAFQSAGQRCSALRVLYLQRDISEKFLTMLYGAMDALDLGDPWSLATDIGPVIDREAHDTIANHIAAMEKNGRLLKRLDAPLQGHFVAPTVLRVDGISELEQEIFGPVLHVATFDADEINAVVDAVNAKGYGLTFGLHTRIDDRVQQIVDRIRAGNIYVNRNQIGAVVGSQPFGGEGLSGTGPKAGGPSYLQRFCGKSKVVADVAVGKTVTGQQLKETLRGLTAPDQAAVEVLDMPGPTGESNRLSHYPRGIVLCLGPGASAARIQARMARQHGNRVLIVAEGAGPDDADCIDGTLDPVALADGEGIGAIISWADEPRQRAIRKALAARNGPIVPLVDSRNGEEMLSLERHLCIDTTAAGGNASLLASTEQD
ncbi:MAG: bifunctional proline dehydrogenase/L-glutamate gamma-semialdehyde dehydrogenase PutA [Geminicoccaceae bacterium]|nr:bifunctional proline dehydrogenase/L-glutamate gamma-semialdehyde dehydrogenase PutA [Geminicoccaceae bacterium]